MRHAKPSEEQIAALSSALGKRGWDGPCDSGGSSVGGVVSHGKVIMKIRKEYYAPGMLLEFESSGDENGEEFAPPGKEGGEERLKVGSDSDGDGEPRNKILRSRPK